MKPFSVIEAPSVLGLRPTGVERLPEALRKAGLLDGLKAEDAGRVSALPYNPVRDQETLLLNPRSLQEFSLRLAGAVEDVLAKNRFPLVLGGDCSVLIGCLLALRRRGRYGLFFLDGHADFYQPEASPTGEVADMELAIVTGRGPNVLANIDGLKPLVRDEDVTVFGFRDAEEAARSGSQDVKDTSMSIFDLETVRDLDVGVATSRGIQRLTSEEVVGFWIHLDADVLNDAVMPAVDYRMPGGLRFAELTEALRLISASNLSVGMTITIFNPDLDADGIIARNFVTSLVAGLRE